MWGSFFFVGSETTRIRTKLVEGRSKETQPVDSYLTWLKNKGGEADKVVVKPFGKGIGLFASQDIAKGDVIAEVPYLVTLGPETATKCAPFSTDYEFSARLRLHCVEPASFHSVGFLLWPLMP